MLELTSYERLRRYLAGSGSNLLTDSANNRRDILTWIASVSNKIQHYINRNVETGTYTEYFDLKYGTKQFWVNSPDITSITSVKMDSIGKFDGGESTLDSSEYFIGTNNNTVTMVYTQPYIGNRIIQIVYVGGMAASGVQSIFVTAQTGTWTVNKYCIGDDSQAVGLVRAQTATTLTIEVLYGVFQASETLTEYDEEAGTTATGSTATLTSKSQTALCEAYPDLTMACEIEIRYLKEHKLNFEDSGTDRDATTIRRNNSKMHSMPLQPETYDILQPYRRIAFT